ncbi:MAG: FHA domain-containing protein, partial [Micromonosporaceae bacterium]
MNRVEVEADCVLRLGHPENGPVLLCSVAGAPGNGHADTALALPPTSLSVDRRPTSVRPAPVRAMRIGRSPDNDVVLTDLGVSRHHAELRNLGSGRYEIRDLDSH